MDTEVIYVRFSRILSDPFRAALKLNWCRSFLYKWTKHMTIQLMKEHRTKETLQLMSWICVTTGTNSVQYGRYCFFGRGDV